MLPDIHCPHEDTKTLAAVLEYAKSETWDTCILIGDLVDMNCISRFTRKSERERAGETIFDEYEHTNAVLDRIQKAVRAKNADCEMVLLEGNHENRVEQYINEFPMFEGILEVPKCLRLKERGIKWVPCYQNGKPYRIGHARFHHGLYTNKYHASKMVSHFGTNIFYGHTHDVQEIAWEMQGSDKTIKGKSLGCLCEYDQKYMKGRPSKWQQAFAVFYFYPDGYFQEQTAAIFRHRFVGPTDGKVYDGRTMRNGTGGGKQG